MNHHYPDTTRTVGTRMTFERNDGIRISDIHK